MSNDGQMLARVGTNAALWADEFAKTARDVARRNTDSDTDSLYSIELAALTTDAAPGGWLHAWFCNLIEAGRAAGRTQENHRLLEPFLAVPADQASVLDYLTAEQRMRGLALEYHRINPPKG